ncbi:MAG: CHAT domain-containing protein [Bradymonadia bacterium]
MRRGAAVTALLGLGVWACERAPQAPTTPSPTAVTVSSAPPPRVVLGGCTAFLTPARCEYTAGQRLTFVSTTADALRFTLDDAPLDAMVEVSPDGAPGGGTRWRLTPPVGAQGRLKLATPSGAEALGMDLAVYAADPTVAEASALRKAGRAPESLSLLDREIARGGDPTGLLHAARTRLHLNASQMDLAQADFDAATTRFAATGRRSDAASLRGALTWSLVYRRRDYPRARAVIADVATDEGGPWGEGRALGTYYEGLIARESGDLRLALERLATAEALARRLGLEERRLAALQSLAMLRVHIGRADEAVAALADALRARDAPADGCVRAPLANNLGWALHRAGRSEEALAPLQAALTDAERCALADVEVEAALNLALAHLETERLEEARRLAELAAKASERLGGRPAQHALLVRAEVERRAGRGRDAQARFERLVELARASGNLGLEREATLGLARLAATRRGALETALRHHRAHDVLAQREAAAIPVSAGREDFWSQSDAAQREHVALLVQAGWAPEALEVARAGRGQALRALDARLRVGALDADRRARFESALAAWRGLRDALDREAAGDWALPADALARALRERTSRRVELEASLDRALAVLGPAPQSALAPLAPGVLLLGLFPGLRGTWSFAADEAGVRVVELPETSPEVLGRRVLERHADALRAARRVHLALAPQLVGLDLHALPFEGAPLYKGRPVVWTLDLPPDATASTKEASVALVVSDPRGDLPAARDEGRHAADALQRQGLEVQTLMGEQADGTRVREALGLASWFHYAGHGVFAGHAGWDSALPLAGHSTLSINDVLALPRVPQRIVLSGCETGKTALDTSVFGAGLAQAFLVAGAREAVAATRPIDDRVAAAVVAALYATPSDPPRDLAERLAAAQARIGPEHPEVSAFRVWSR